MGTKDAEAEKIRRKILRKQIQERFEGNMAAFARSAGVYPQQITDILSDPPLRAFGERFREKLERNQGLPAHYYDGLANDLLVDYVQVPLVQVKVSAGVTGFATAPSTDVPRLLHYRRDWLKSEGREARNLFAMLVSGNSMEPSLFDSDMVVVDTSKTTPHDGVVYCINYEGETIIKRLRRESGEWLMTSDNADRIRFAPKRMNGESIIIGEVVYKHSSHI